MTFFIPNFNLLSCESDNLCLKCYNESIYIDIILDQTKIVEPIHNNLTVVFEKFKMVSLASSIMKDIVVFATRFRAIFFWKLFVVLLLNQH